MQNSEKEQKVLDAERIVNIIIALIGLVLILVGILARQFSAETETIVISVGSSLLASALVAFLSSVYIRQYKHAKEIAEVWGIQSIADKRATMNIEIAHQMKNAHKHLDYIAFGLTSLRQGNTPGVKDCLSRGAEMRILTVSPENARLNIRDREEGKLEGSTSKSIRDLTEWVQALNTEFPGKASIRFSDTIPTEYYFRADDYIYVGPYQFGKESQQTITMEFKGSGKAFAYYSQYFDDLWNDWNFCSPC